MARSVIPSSAVPVIDTDTGLMSTVWYQFFLGLSTPIPGWAAATGTASRATFATTTVTTEQLAQRFKALIDDKLSRGQLGL